MKNINLKIVSLTLTGFLLLSTSSCKIQKKDNEITKIIDFDDDRFNNISDNQIKDVVNDMILKIEEKGYDLPIEDFILKLSNTIFIKNPSSGFTLGSYNDDEHIFTYIENDVETIRHELLHMLLPSHNNASIDEGLVQLFLNDLYGYNIEENVFDASLCKLFVRILSSDELKKFIMGDTDVLKNKLASIKPNYNDADQFLIYANNGEYYRRIFAENVFNNNEDEFKKTDEYKYLKEYRRIVKDRIKVYLFCYYSNLEFDCTPYDRLVEIFEVLNIVNYFMYDTKLDEINENDYFLKPIVDDICIKYKIDDETLHMADLEAKNCMYFEYLNKLSNNNSKIK